MIYPFKKNVSQHMRVLNEFMHLGTMAIMKSMGTAKSLARI